jgi:hypothetical protein
MADKPCHPERSEALQGRIMDRSLRSRRQERLMTRVALPARPAAASRIGRHSAAAASPICSQVGATSETVARRMSRL